MSQVSEHVTRLRLFGPCYVDTQNNWLQSVCFWCRHPVQLQAFFPLTQPENPGDDSLVGRKPV